MRIGQLQFKPTLIGSVATLGMLAVLLSLGSWQLRRADEKRALQSQLQAGASTTQLANAANIESLPMLQLVMAHGAFDARQILLDNMWSSAANKGGARPGFNVLTPLLLEDGHIVLVNRGFIPLTERRDVLPDVSVSSDKRSIRALVSHIPQPGMRLGKNPETAGWPRILNYPTLDELRALYGDKLLPRILLLDPAETDGFERAWQARYNFDEFGPSKHIGYAVQWFGLALALVVIYFVVHLKKPQ